MFREIISPKQRSERDSQAMPCRAEESVVLFGNPEFIQSIRQQFGSCAR